MLGAVVGDIVGSAWEFRRIKTKDFPLFLEHSSFTDDSVLTAAIADALLNQKDPIETLRDWPRKVRISHKVGGYGKRFMEWVAKPKPQPPYQSFGNGSAMRISPCAWLAGDLSELKTLSLKVTETTHDHPEGMKGALATAEAIWFTKHGASAKWIRSHIQDTHGYVMHRSVDEIRPVYRYSEACQDSVPEAIICALEATSFEDALRNAVSLGGDSDTMAAIAGSIAEARFEIPERLLMETAERLQPSFSTLIAQFYEELETRSTPPPGIKLVQSVFKS